MFQGVISRDEWGARPPSGYSGEQFLDEGMVVHWEGPFLGWPWDHARCFELVRGIQRYHMDAAGYSDIAYNDVHCPHGWVFSARWGVPMANAASGDAHVNRHAPAHCLLWGQGDDADPNAEGEQLTEDAWDSIVAVRGFWIANHGMSLAVRGHREIISTMCPGPDAQARVEALDGTDPAGGIVVPVPGTGNPVPITPPEAWWPAWPGRFLSYPPVMRGDDVYVWQARMAERGWRIDVDGAFGPQSSNVARAFQADKGLVVDGIVGPVTWDAAWTAPVT